MKNKMKSIWSLAIITILYSTSCTKPLDIDVPQAKPKIAIFSQIIPNEIMMVGVTKSFNALTDVVTATEDSMMGGILLEHALVTVKHAAETDTLEALVPGIYGSSTVNLVDGDYYDLYVYDSVSGESVTSRAQVKPLVNDSMKVTVDRTSGDTTANIKFRITDNRSTDDFYYINIARGGKNDFLSGATKYFNNLDIGTTLMIFSDKEAINQVIEKEYNSGLILDTFSVQSDSVSITVSSISREYYLFLDAYKRNRSIFAQLFGEPINYPSNVENGLGVFTAHLPKFYFIDLKDY
jgi:hypothetical protein